MRSVLLPRGAPTIDGGYSSWPMSIMRTVRFATCGVALASGALVTTLPVAHAAAQPVPATTRPAPARGPLLTRRDLTTAGAAIVLTGALMPFDRRIARWSQRPGLQRSRAAGTAADVFNFAGSPGALILGGATYGVGLLAQRRATADVGLHATGAVIAASVVTSTAKVLIGRARPYVTGDSNATDYGFGRGLRGGSAYQSLPSGHATAAFALAGAFAAEGAYRWPQVNRVTGPVGFAAATLVAAARVYRNRHWASDVALGGGIGAVTGAALVRYTHARPGNAVDRRLLPRTTASPIAVSWTVRF